MRTPLRTRIPLDFWLCTQFPPRHAATVRWIQGARLSRLLAFARRHSPYYRRLGLTADPDRLPDLPLLTREQLRDRCAEIVTVPPETSGIRARFTSGWSGRPLRVPTSREEVVLDALLWLQIYRGHGLRPWHRQGKFTQTGMNPNERAFRHTVLYPRDYIPVVSSPEQKVRTLRAATPSSLVGWASLLGEVALQLEKEKARLRIPLLFSTSDMLWPSLRARIEDRLGGRVVDTYGAIETGPIAFECRRRRGYHVRSDYVVVELLDERGRPARAGRVVCTPLWRRVTPLIRYELGDYAEWADGPCPCGNPLPLLERLHGRQQDLWKLPSGEWMSAGRLEEVLLSDLSCVRGFQFIREAENSLRLQLVTLEPLPKNAERRIVERFHRAFDASWTLRVERVAAIAKRPGEKFKAFVDRTGPRASTALPEER